MRLRIIPLATGLVLTALAALGGCSDGGEAAEPLSEQEALYQKGRRQARMCVSCHGPGGESRVASYPSLAGLSETYLIEQLHAFRDGERHNPQMNAIASNLDDEAIAALAHYFANQSNE